MVRRSTPGEFYQRWYEETHKFPRGTKAKLLRRDGKGCVMCGSQQRLSIHHYYDGTHENNPYAPDNCYNLNYLVLLCGSCHGKAHTARYDTPFMRTLFNVVDEKRKAVS